MAYQFAQPPIMQRGDIFLGVRDDGAQVGISTPRHLITIAGARSGKGAGLIIPNLREWSGGSILCVDTKGENAAASWQQREAMGHKVYVVDPFGVADVPDRLRVTFNPLAEILDRETQRRGAGLPSTAREDIRVIADGLVMRYDSKHGMWDNGYVSVIAGMIAYCLATADPDHCNLAAVRRVLRFPDDQLEPIMRDMAEIEAFGGLTQSAAKVGLSAAKSAREYMKGAGDNTEWLDSEPMAEILARSDFSLSELKNGKTAVFLVLPPEYLAEHGRFLRLFVRCAVNAMAKGGQGNGKCLFVLDEFFALGHIDEIAKAAGLMPSYGVHLWPILQDLGQLVTLYGKEGAETFFGNSDAHIFFGNTDPISLEHVSARLGRLSPSEVVENAPDQEPYQDSTHRRNGESEAEARERHRVEHANRIAQYQHSMGMSGRPRFAPDEIRELVARHPVDAVARSMLVFATGGAVWNLRLAPYFAPPPPPLETPAPPMPAPQPEPDKSTLPIILALWGGLAFAFAALYGYADAWNYAAGCMIGGIALIASSAILKYYRINNLRPS